MKKLLYILLAIIAVLLIVVFAIGRDYHYEKSIVINAPAEKIYPHINSTKAFNEWNPWLQLAPNMDMQYSGTQGQVGDKYCWKSEVKGAGSGCQEIVELIPNQKQTTKMYFEGQGEATSNITLTPEGNGTKVTWDMDSEFDYPMNLIKLMMDSWMEKPYSKGLNDLKTLSEK